MMQKKQMLERLRPTNPFFKTMIQPAESGTGMSSGNMKSGGSSAG